MSRATRRISWSTLAVSAAARTLMFRAKPAGSAMALTRQAAMRCTAGMAIDPSKLAEWRQLTDGGRGSACWHCGADLMATQATARIASLADAVPALLAEVEALRELLREVEWSGNLEGIGEPCCPACRCIRYGDVPHLPDCRLAAAIK